MKKRLLTGALSGAILVSATFGAMPYNVLAQAISSVQVISNGTMLFPNDVISFDSNAKIIYNGGTAGTKEIPIDNKMVILPGYGDIFGTEDSGFYGWKTVTDTIDTETGKRTVLELSPVTIKYDYEKADLKVTFPTSGTDTTPLITLSVKSGYTLDSLANGISYDQSTGKITIPAGTDGNILLGDTYKEDVTKVTLLKDGAEVESLTACPEKSATLQFSATALMASGKPASAPVTWKLNDDIEEFISISDTGLVTVTPYFTGDDFTVTATSGESSDSVTVKMEHSYGQWLTLVPPTVSAPGTEQHTCELCGANETRSVNQLQAPVYPTGTITLNATTSWNELATTESYTAVKDAHFVITSGTEVAVKEVSYIASPSLLTKEQLDQVSEWTVGTEFNLAPNSSFYVYAKLTSTEDKVTYISTNKIIADNTAPVINGITDNTTYYETKTFTVTEQNLYSVTVNEKEVYPENGVFTLKAEDLAANGYLYTIIASDKSGNATTLTGYVKKPVTANNKITGITDDATYRRGSIIRFEASGDGMANENPQIGDIRYLPYSYTVANDTELMNGKYRQPIITSTLKIGLHSLAVLFKEQIYNSGNGWTDTGVTDTKYASFSVLNRKEIESVRGTPRASFYTVKFETNGGTKIDYVLVDRLKFLKEPVSPTKVGYKFDGWYTNESLTKEYDFSQRVSENFTLYAKWTKTSASSDDNIFSDVSKGDQYYENIAYVYASGLMNGTGDAEFSPDMPTTRAMIVTILYRLEDEPSASYSSFSDVPSDSYYAKAVAWAKKNNIVNGMDQYNFAPNKEISREQLMTILYRFAEYKDYDRSSQSGLGEYTDADQIASYANSAFQWAVATKVAAGRTEKFLSPKAFATRAEVAMAFQNFIEGNVM